MPRKTTRMFARKFKSIGIVDAGACEGAEIIIAKHRNDMPRPDVAAEKRVETFRAEHPTVAAKMDSAAASFAEIAGTAEARSELDEMVRMLCDSFYRILGDAAADKPTMLAQSVAEFAAAATAKVPGWFGVAKAGAKMSVVRLGKLTAALQTLQDIMTDVVGSQEDNMAEKKTEKKTFDVSKLDTEAKAYVDELAGQVTALTAEVETLKAKPLPAEEDAWKGVSPEVRKRIEDSEKRAADAEAATAVERDKRETAEYVEKAKAYRGLPVKAAAFGVVLKHLHSNALTDADKTEIERVLKAADEALVTGAFKVLGHGDNGNDARQQIQALAVAKRTATPGMSAAEARIAVRKEHPELAQRERETTH